MMEKQQVKRIIQGMAQRDLLLFLIDRANLTEKERRVIECGVMLDSTQEETAERLDRSVRWMQDHEQKAYKKLIENWSGIDFLGRL